MRKIVIKIGALAVGALPVISFVSCDKFKKKVINREKLVEDIYKKFGYELSENNKKENIKIIIDFFDGGLKNINKEDLMSLYIKEGRKEKDAQIFMNIIFNNNILERIFKKGFADLKVKTKNDKEMKFSEFINSIFTETIENNEELNRREFFTKIFVGFDNVQQFKNILTKFDIKLPNEEILESFFLKIPMFKKGLLYSSIDDLAIFLSNVGEFFKNLNEIENQNFQEEITELFKLFDNFKKDAKDIDDEFDINNILSKIGNSNFLSNLQWDAKEEAKKINQFINGGLLGIMKSNSINFGANEFDYSIDLYLKILNEGLDNWEEEMQTLLEYKGSVFKF